jgi:uncharacterized SAM-binding protein YcdF (DUF218 family)
MSNFTIQEIYGIAAFCTFSIGILFFIIYKGMSMKTTPDKAQLLGYFGKALIAITIVLNALGNFYAGKKETQQEQEEFLLF